LLLDFYILKLVSSSELSNSFNKLNLEMELNSTSWDLLNLKFVSILLGFILKIGD